MSSIISSFRCSDLKIRQWKTAINALNFDSQSWTSHLPLPIRLKFKSEIFLHSALFSWREYSTLGVASNSLQEVRTVFKWTLSPLTLQVNLKKCLKEVTAKLHRYNSYYLGYDITIPDSFSCRNEKLSSIIRYVALHRALEICPAQLLSVTLALKSPLKSPS